MLTLREYIDRLDEIMQESNDGGHSFFMITAEHVQGPKDLLSELSARRIHVELAWRDPSFDSMYKIVIHGSKQDAETVRELMWKRNGGAYCKVRRLTDDEIDDML